MPLNNSPELLSQEGGDWPRSSEFWEVLLPADQWE